MSEPARVFELPDAGPARLRPAEVASSQRLRMLRAMAETAAEKGYAKTVVADVITRAGVSRRTFYEHFRDKQDCFLAAYDATIDALEGAVSEELAAAASLAPAEQLDRLLRTYLELLASEPRLAKTYLVEVYAAGPEAMARRRAVLERFSALLGGLRPVDPFTLEALVSAVSMLVTTRVASGRADTLPELREPLLRFLLDNLLVRNVTDTPGT